MKKGALPSESASVGRRARADYFGAETIEPWFTPLPLLAQ